MGGRRFLRTSAAVCPGSGKGCSLRVPVGEPLFPLPLKALLSLSFQNSPARGVPRPRKWPFARNLASVSCEMAGKNFVQLFRTPHKKIRWEGLAELSRPQTTEGKEAPSFPATCASEMTPLMTDRATFLQESSPVRHASLCRKRPKAFFDRLNSPRLCRGLFACLSKNVYQMSTIGTFKPEKPTFFVLTYHSPYKIRSARRVILGW